MPRALLLPLIFGIVGTGILVALGAWQLQRLEWKRAVLSEIETRISAEPGPLPARPDPEGHRFRPVAVTGRIGTEVLYVLTSTRGGGPGYRIVSPFVTEGGRRVLVDRGFVPQDRKEAARPVADAVTVLGNLHWPEETDSFTPEPDLAENIWYARDVAAMSRALDTEPVMIVARQIPGDAPAPLPIGTERIPNNHLEYALTWFALALVWAGMTVFLLWRIRPRIV